MPFSSQDIGQTQVPQPAGTYPWCSVLGHVRHLLNFINSPPLRGELPSMAQVLIVWPQGALISSPLAFRSREGSSVAQDVSSFARLSCSAHVSTKWHSMLVSTKWLVSPALRHSACCLAACPLHFSLWQSFDRLDRTRLAVVESPTRCFLAIRRGDAKCI